MTNNETSNDDNELSGIWLSVTGGVLTGDCAFCGAYAELVTTTADDLVCETCKREFEDFLEKGESE